MEELPPPPPSSSRQHVQSTAQRFNWMVTTTHNHRFFKYNIQKYKDSEGQSRNMLNELTVFNNCIDTKTVNKIIDRFQNGIYTEENINYFLSKKILPRYYNKHNITRLVSMFIVMGYTFLPETIDNLMAFLVLNCNVVFFSEIYKTLLNNHLIEKPSMILNNRLLQNNFITMDYCIETGLVPFNIYNTNAFYELTQDLTEEEIHELFKNDLYYIQIILFGYKREYFEFTTYNEDRYNYNIRNYIIPFIEFYTNRFF